MRTSLAKSSSSPGVKLVRRIRPLFPVVVLTPVSRCPHGVEIRRDRICIVCSKAAQVTQDVVDALPTPPPVNPETRALEQIAFFRQWLASHPDATTLMKLHVMRQIMDQEKIVREWIPTRYLPARLKGGTG